MGALRQSWVTVAVSLIVGLSSSGITFLLARQSLAFQQQQQDVATVRQLITSCHAFVDAVRQGDVTARRRTFVSYLIAMLEAHAAVRE